VTRRARPWRVTVPDPGDAHLFTDRSLDVYDPAAASLVLERTLELLARVDASS
jgi:hypothetical protein